MATLELILNGKSAANEEVRHAVYRLRSEGTGVNVHVTWEGGDAARYAASFANRPDCRVVAGGCDGTINEVLQGLLGNGPCACCLGVLPLGTANDFATSAGIPSKSCYESLRIAATVSPRAVDVGSLNGHYFLNVASGGFGAEVTSQTSVVLKNAIGGAAYALEACIMALRSSAYRIRLTTPDNSFEGDVVMFAVGNGRQAGGGAHMTPHALVNDGLLDVMLVPDHADEKFFNLMHDLAKLKFNESEGFHYLKASQLRIESERDLQINLDGEPIKGKAFSFAVLPSALNVLLPPDCPLFIQG